MIIYFLLLKNYFLSTCPVYNCIVVKAKVSPHVQNNDSVSPSVLRVPDTQSGQVCARINWELLQSGGQCMGTSKGSTHWWQDYEENKTKASQQN